MKLFQPIFGARGEDVKLRGLKKILEKTNPNNVPTRSFLDCGSGSLHHNGEAEARAWGLEDGEIVVGL